jgi:acyl-CoA hydrolase
MPSPPLLTPEAAVEAIAQRANGALVVIQGGPSEPLALRDAWQAAPELAAGLRFCGLMLAGVNDFDYTSLHPTTGLDLFLATPALAPAIAAGRATARPMAYSAIPGWLTRQARGAAVVQVSPPGSDGACSLGLCADIGEIALRNAGFRLGLINHQMPDIAYAPRIAISHFDALVEVDMPLAVMAATARAAAGAMAEHLLPFITNGATIQIGIGKAPNAVLPALAAREGLRFHGGLLSAGQLALAQAGHVRADLGALTGGTALGDNAFFAALAQDPRTQIAPIEHTHGFETIKAMPGFTAINAVLEIDLFGQTNAEWAGGRWIASQGGLPDFIRAAKASRGGRAIFLASAQGANGACRILPRLQSPCVTTARGDADVFVTEFGAADVRDLAPQARAEAIAALAAPDHRADLLKAWRS